MPSPVRRTAAVAGLAVVLAGLARFRLLRFAIAEDSMAPALRAGDYVVARRVRHSPERGAVVVFAHPAQSDFHLVKRVVGLPGERVEIAAGAVSIDGREHVDHWACESTRPAGTWSLQSGECFVLGDARDRSSADSREIGPVPVVRLEAEVLFRYWPRPGRIG